MASNDKHVRRTGSDYAIAFRALLPQGLAWPISLTSVLSKVISGLAQIWGYVDGRAADLLEIETDPRLTIELLEEWEQAFGLPDHCFPIAPTDPATRRFNLVSRMTMLGEQSRAFFIARGLDIGETVQIREFAPYMCGVSRCGDTRVANVENSDPYNFRWQLGPPENRFYWTVKILALLPSFLGADLSCFLRRWKPAHTDVLLDYSVVGVNQLDFSEPIWDSSYIALL
jgi:uncharacterized protein YmfQ (DUF2313 family)